MGDTRLTVVGIGASAGGLEAFQVFFKNMPPDSGLAFVVVLHLPQHSDSDMLSGILARWTSMPVEKARDGALIAPNCVYVPPANAVTTVAGGTLRVRLREVGLRHDDNPIDGFFDSLANELGDSAVGVVLSGSGSDGALGLKAIKAAGGLTVAQGTDGSAPQYADMPVGAIATGMIDLVLPVESIPGQLVRLHRAREQGDEFAAATLEQTEAMRLRICAILRRGVGHDFSGYKDKTFLRRVQRRMQVLNIRALPDYVRRLESSPDEIMLLFKDLLIRVTSFFRDSETFDVLAREVIPLLFEGKQAEDTVRVWVPGCATGEEAYSLAILMREHADGLGAPPRMQVFATDIDEPAIATARAGRYPTMLLEGMSEARRARFFTLSQTSCVVAKEIRNICTFSPQSLVRDPPFSQMNMISCRNLLIYFDSTLQARIIPSFHYSLVPGGILLLGSSETISRHEDLFTPISASRRIYLRREVPTPPLPFGHQQPLPRTRLAASGRAQGEDQQSAGLGAGGTGATADGSDPEGEPGTGEAGLGWVERAQSGLRLGLSAARNLLPGSPENAELRRALRETREQLQSITEEHETSLEELRSANEELHSVNEELQSTNEELETSKEEIQSVNEELHTVNAQLSEKVDELDRNASDLKNLFDSTEVATVFLDRNLVIRGYTPAVGDIYNLIPSDHGRPLTDIVSQLRYHSLREDVAYVLDTLQPLERRVIRADRDVHYIMRILPYRAPDSSVDGTLVTFLDVTSIVQAEIHQRLLVDELNHRVKNMLTVVISLASQTLRHADSLEMFSDAFLGRITALSASYSLLSRANWTDIALLDVMLEEVRPFLSRQRDNIILEGPAVRLAPQGALAIGMAVHELATNAVKHGALSNPGGTVHIGWRIDTDDAAPALVLDWRERGGPPVQAPRSRGFGTTLIERGFAHELSGRATIEFHPEGVRASLRAPVGTAVLAPAMEAVRS